MHNPTDTFFLPYCPTALLPYCPTALLPYCPTGLFPYSPTSPPSSPYGPTAAATAGPSCVPSPRRSLESA
ncbi:MAG: hypothetical protein E5X87_03715 [Mesorhizobium sp.]|nr:MAG: hypothetical protein E5X87_03715 [Mesorhizobium sp.]